MSDNLPLILVAEDDPLIRMLVGDLLKKMGYRVNLACDGAEAVRMLEEEVPALILSDIRMPNMDGYALLKEVRRLLPWHSTPFIFMSAKVAAADIRMGMALGADDYLTKPFEPDDLFATIRTRLSRASELAAVVQDRDYFMLRTMPHELRTPLSGIMGFAELMVRDGNEGRGLSPADTREFGDCMYRSAQRIMRIIENLTLWSELSTTKKSLRLSEDSARPSPWERGLKHDIQRQAEEYGRELDLRCQLDPAVLLVPEKQLRQVVVHLVDNALKFSLPGTRIQVTGRVDDAGQYELKILDRGRGMTPDQIARIHAFLQFEREKSEQQGLGLGLAIARRFAELSGGQLAVDHCDDGEGLRVALRIPCAVDAGNTVRS